MASIIWKITKKKSEYFNKKKILSATHCFALLAKHANSLVISVIGPQIPKIHHVPHTSNTLSPLSFFLPLSH